MRSVELVVKTIQMKPPIFLKNGNVNRQLLEIDDEGKILIDYESYLRRKAYQNTTINIDESFFNDIDMTANYFLVVVYDSISNTPLLSSRHYFDKQIILQYLKGDNNKEMDTSIFSIEEYDFGKIFLADRLSGNIGNLIYLQHHTEIFSLYHSEIVSKNQNCTLLLMVKKEKEERQLSKYLGLGFDIIGSTIHKGREHSIIIRDLNR